MNISIKLLNSEAKVPTYGTPNSAGLDLYSTENVILTPQIINYGEHNCPIDDIIPNNCNHCDEINDTVEINRTCISTGISLAIPSGYYGSIRPRSGLALKYGIHVLAGIIDSDYRGEIKVILINFGTENLEIKIGDRVAQLIIQKYEHVNLTVVDNLNDTQRGISGFGSTGI